MSLLYIEKIPSGIRTAFSEKLLSIASVLGVNPDWLMQVMWAESKLKPNAANRQGTDKHLVAAGILQFTAACGIVKAGKVPTLDSILKMPLLSQLDLVLWYFTPYKNRLRSYYDVYAVTFFPAIIGKPDNWVLQKKGVSPATIAQQNKIISKGKAAITVADFKRYVVGLVPESIRERIFGAVKKIVEEARDDVRKVQEIMISHPQQSTGLGAAFLIGLCFLGWVIIREG